MILSFLRTVGHGRLHGQEELLQWSAETWHRVSSQSSCLHLPGNVLRYGMVGCDGHSTVGIGCLRGRHHWCAPGWTAGRGSVAHEKVCLLGSMIILLRDVFVRPYPEVLGSEIWRPVAMVESCNGRLPELSYWCYCKTWNCHLQVPCWSMSWPAACEGSSLERRHAPAPSRRSGQSSRARQPSSRRKQGSSRQRWLPLLRRLRHRDQPTCQVERFRRTLPHHECRLRLPILGRIRRTETCWQGSSLHSGRSAVQSTEEQVHQLSYRTIIRASKLQPTDDEEGSDYINSNYVTVSVFLEKCILCVNYSFMYHDRIIRRLERKISDTMTIFVGYNSIAGKTSSCVVRTGNHDRLLHRPFPIPGSQFPPWVRGHARSPPFHPWRYVAHGVGVELPRDRHADAVHRESSREMRPLLAVRHAARLLRGHPSDRGQRVALPRLDHPGIQSHPWRHVQINPALPLHHVAGFRRTRPAADACAVREPGIVIRKI